MPAMNSGIVLDIFRCSLHDGPGIRTAVFLKGCPLGCLWCHNPESQAMAPVLSFNAERCTRCGACVPACPNACHTVQANQHTINRAACTACGQCAAVCPANALEIKGRLMTVDQVIAEVSKDADYYRGSGGGLTLTGGEPMMQFDFTRALLSAARQLGIHTAIETSGAASAGHYRQILPLIDLFLFDYKGTDPALHAQHTGASNGLILQNLDMLYTAGANITLRCPLVPGINDTDQHLAGIAAMAKRYPRLTGIEIMPYHPMGNEKARRTGLPEPPEFTPADAAIKAAWRVRLNAHGCTDVVIN